tara:strand:+ start:322 stop:1119 length:798 start_codon:yes stop_codon:yes gene_type:complete
MREVSNNSLVSILMPAFNSEKYIEESINSVLAQTYKNWELIIIDDVSTDNTSSIVKNIAINDSRIRFIQKQTRDGAANSRNIGIKKAQGRFIAFLDSDDIWKTKKLEKQIFFMEKYKYDFTYSFYSEFDIQKNSVLIKSPKSINRFKLAFFGNIGCLTVMYDKSKLGDFTIKRIKKRNDYALWLAILQKAKKGYCLEENLASYRKTNEGLSSGNKFSLIIYYFKVMRMSFRYWFIIIPITTPIYLTSLILKKYFLAIYNLLIIKI